MTLVAATTGLFALGAYLGRNLSEGWGWALFIAAFACLIAMRFAVRRSSSPAVGLLFVFGVLTGSLRRQPSPTTPERSRARCGRPATPPHCSWLARRNGLRQPTQPLGHRPSLVLGLGGLIAFGIVMIFANIPGGALIDSIAGVVIFAGLVIFAALTMVDSQRLRLSEAFASSSMLTASIFLSSARRCGTGSRSASPRRGTSNR